MYELYLTAKKCIHKITSSNASYSSFCEFRPNRPTPRKFLFIYLKLLNNNLSYYKKRPVRVKPTKAVTYLDPSQPESNPDDLVTCFQF